MKGLLDVESKNSIGGTQSQALYIPDTFPYGFFCFCAFPHHFLSDTQLLRSMQICSKNMWDGRITGYYSMIDISGYL
jgi:hypothetical protein